MTRKQKIIFYGLLLVSVLSCAAAAYLLLPLRSRETGWVSRGEFYSYLDSSGHPLTGWQTVGDSVYYFDGNGHMVTGWVQLEDGRYFFDGVGHPVTGWVQQGFLRWHFDENGKLDTGWQTIDGQRYFFSETGGCITGWLSQDGKTYYLKPSGAAAKGITEIDSKLYYFDEQNEMVTGWRELSSGRFYFNETGEMVTGWQQIGLERYFFLDSGILYTGWLTWGEDRYYLREDGAAAHGMVELNGETHFFTPKGIEVLLVNEQHPIPASYRPDLVTFEDWYQICGVAAEPIKKMLTDCRNAGFEVKINNTYRTKQQQETILTQRTEVYQGLGLDYGSAYAKARETVALPGTSEHQLGLAADLVGDEANEWLAVHCWEYGFIVRYPDGKSEITGIAYEPWHYRYVGKAAAADMKDSGLCLEEYVGAVPVG